MARRTRLILCHDCGGRLAADDRLHYGYQCHACVVVEHDLVLVALREPDHPDAGPLRWSAVDLGLKIDSGGSLA